jgi:hypothetical protein
LADGFCPTDSLDCQDQAVEFVLGFLGSHCQRWRPLPA